MRKLLVVLGVIVALAIPTAALAAELSNGSNQTCEGGIGVWHFVNNQTDGAAAGELTAYFDSGTFVTGPRLPVNNKTQHFYVTTDGAATLQDASTNLPGKLVLSDFTCEAPKK